MCSKECAETFTLHAIVNGKSALLTTRDGELVARVALDRVTGDLNAEAIFQTRSWKSAAERLRVNLRQRIERFYGDGWKKSLLRLERTAKRKAQGRKSRKRRRPTHCWHQCSVLLSNDAYSRFRRNRMGGWERWTNSAANAVNKRRGGPYARENYN